MCCLITVLMFQETVKETGETGIEEAVLEGHLGIAKELLNFLPPEKKYQLGSEEKAGVNLIKVIVQIQNSSITNVCAIRGFSPFMSLAFNNSQGSLGQNFLFWGRWGINFDPGLWLISGWAKTNIMYVKYAVNQIF